MLDEVYARKLAATADKLKLFPASAAIFFKPDGTPTEFMLNAAPYDQSGIIVADRNFGCGSSRETAVYALYEFGIRCVIAPSFGDIFAANCAKNGLLALTLRLWSGEPKALALRPAGSELAEEADLLRALARFIVEREG